MTAVRSDPARGSVASAGPFGWPGLSWATLAGGALFAVSIFFWIESFDEAYAVSEVSAGRGPMFYPRILLVAWTLLALVVTLRGLREPPIGGVNRRVVATVLATIAVTGLYVAGILAAGFLIASLGFVLALPLVLGYRKPMTLGALVAIFPVSVWWLFDRLFKIILPTSPWFNRF